MFLERHRLDPFTYKLQRSSTGKAKKQKEPGANRQHWQGHLPGAGQSRGSQTSAPCPPMQAATSAEPQLTPSISHSTVVCVGQV